MCHTGLVPNLASRVGKGYIDVAGGNPPVFGQRQCKRGAAVSGKYADFQIFFRANQLCQPNQNRRLFARNRHFAHTVMLGLLTQPRQNGMFGFADGV